MYPVSFPCGSLHNIYRKQSYPIMVHPLTASSKFYRNLGVIPGWRAVYGFTTSDWRPPNKDIDKIWRPPILGTVSSRHVNPEVSGTNTALVNLSLFIQNLVKHLWPHVTRGRYFLFTFVWSLRFRNVIDASGLTWIKSKRAVLACVLKYTCR